MYMFNLNEQLSYKRGVAGPIPDVIYYSNHAGSQPSTGPRACTTSIHTIYTTLAFIHVTEGTRCSIVRKMASLPKRSRSRRIGHRLETEREKKALGCRLDRVRQLLTPPGARTIANGTL